MNWFQRLIRKQQMESDLGKEVLDHFERQVSDYRRSGLTEEEARRKARLIIGNPEQIREECRDARGTQWAENLYHDLRFAIRSLRRRPGLAIVAGLSLALGIGANTAIFSLMDALMLRALPVAHPAQLVLFGEGRMSGVTDDFPHRNQELFSWPFYKEVQSRSNVFSDVAAVESMWGDVHARFSGTNAELEPVKMQLVSGNYFAMLGVQAAAGRMLTPEDDQRPGGALVGVMRYGYWQRRFNRNPAVVGQSLSVNGAVFTVIGVAAPEFFGTEVGRAPDLWTPLAAQPQVQPWLNNPFDAQTRSLWLMGRMKTGVKISQAEAYINVQFQQWLHKLAGLFPSAERIADMQKAHVRLTSAARGISRLRHEFSRPLELLMVLVGLVLLIACANVANLLLAQAGARRREIAVRVAIGAERKRLIAQLLAESLFLAMIGGSLGLLVAIGGGHLLLAMVSTGPEPVPLKVGLSVPVLLFTVFVSFLTGLLFGIAPALRMSTGNTGLALREGKGLTRSQSSGRLGSLLVAGQVSLAFFLLVGAALFVTTFQNLEQASTGFERDRVLLVQLNSDSVETKGPTLMSLYRRVEARIQALPGVRAASFSMMTFDEGEWNSPVWPKGLSHTETHAKSFSGNRVGAQYFEALKTPIVSGRAFGPQDTPKSQSVAIINQTMARDLYPNASAVGQHFALGDHDDFEIVGIVKDAKYQSVRENPVGMFFVYNGQQQNPDGFNDLVVRAQGRPTALIGEIRAAIRAENPNLVIGGAMTLAEVVNRSLAEEKLLANLAGFFGVLALLLSSIGLYGVIAYSVSSRTHEIGIRMALGALPKSILGQVLRESLVLVGLGLAVGLPAALAFGRIISSQLYEVKATNPVLMIGTVFVLIATALAAAFLPARRAAHLDPVGALRQE
jgi:predicted permease